MPSADSPPGPTPNVVSASEPSLSGSNQAAPFTGVPEESGAPATSRLSLGHSPIGSSSWMPFNIANMSVLNAAPGCESGRFTVMFVRGIVSVPHTESGVN